MLDSCACSGIWFFMLRKYEEYDRDVLREYFSNISKSKLVELCIKLALGDQKTLDEILEEDWDK